MEWFKQSFNQDYMMVYRHRNAAEAREQVIKMIDWLDLDDKKGVSLLDLGCGTGRHSLSLQQMGFKVTGLDLSPHLLQEAKIHDPDERITWVEGDMRQLPFEDCSFDLSLNLFTSFGYFVQQLDNEAVLSEISRILKKQGSFIIDFLNPAYVRAQLDAFSERFDEEMSCTITEHRTIHGDVVEKTIIITPSFGEKRIYKEKVMLLPLEWFISCFEHLGLELKQVYGSYDGETYHSKSPRMIIIGLKK